MKRLFFILILSFFSIVFYSQEIEKKERIFKINQKDIKIDKKDYRYKEYHRYTKRKIIVDLEKFFNDDTLTQVFVSIKGYPAKRYNVFDWTRYRYRYRRSADDIDLYYDMWEIDDDERSLDSLFQDLYDWMSAIEDSANKYLNKEGEIKPDYGYDINGFYYPKEIVFLKSYILIKDLNLDVPNYYAMNFKDITDIKKRFIKYTRRHNIKLML